MTKKTSFYSILIFLMLSIFSSGISAKKKIVLLPFEYKVNKKSGKAVRKFIQKILKNNYEYITKKTIKETMGKDVDWDNVTPEQLKEISGKFMITAYVGGTIKKVKRKFVFVPRLLSWETGENIISKEFKFKRYNLSKKEIELIAMAYLQGIEGLKEYEAPKIEPVKPEVKQVIEEEKPEEIVKKPVALKALDKKKDADWAPLPSLRAGLKLFFMNRALDFTPASEPYYKTAGLSAAPGWDIEVFPMGFKDPTSPLAGIGLKFSGYMMPGFESYPADDEASKVDTSVYEIGFDLVYRYRVLKNLVVRGNLGYLMKSWSFSDKTTLDVPGVSYSAINLTLGARFLIIDKANVEGNISFMMPLDAGDIASADFYGQATLMGLRFNVAFGYEVLKGVEVLAGFDYTRFDFTFDGFGARTADSASDQYISFLLGVRYTM